MNTVAQRMTEPRVIPRALQPSEYRMLLAAGDAVASLLAVVVALWLWSIPAGWQFSTGLVRANAAWFAMAAGWFLVAAIPASLPSNAFSLRRAAGCLLRGAAACLAVYAALYFYSPRGALPRLVILYFLWEAILLTIAWRVVFVAVFSHARFRRRTLIVGSGAAAAAAADAVRRHLPRNVALVGYIPQAVAHGAPGGLPAVAPRQIDAAPVQQVIVALDGAPDKAVLQSLIDWQESGADLVRAQTLLEQLDRRVYIDLLEPDWLLTDLADTLRLRDASWLAKRLLDVAGALAGLVAGAVLLPFIAAAILVDSGRPVFYRQRRLSRGGVPFDVLKFRTMVRDAERPGEAVWAGPADPRATRVGRWLRRTRLDEMPQFVNVLRGEMSLVGPRPEREEFVAELQKRIPFYRARLHVPPGLTGWAQVNLPYGDSIEGAKAKLEYDLYYVKHRSLLFDLSIIARTIGTVLRLRGH